MEVDLTLMTSFGTCPPAASATALREQFPIELLLHLRMKVFMRKIIGFIVKERVTDFFYSIFFILVFLGGKSHGF